MLQQDTKFDENLYSRQVAVLGAETQSKLIQMKCFIHGLRGLGLEIAKNLILAGPKSVTVYDPTVLAFLRLVKIIVKNKKFQYQLLAIN